MECQRWQKTSPQQKWVGFVETDWSIDRSIWLIRAQWVSECVSDWVIVKYSHLSPCGHPAITDTPIIRTAAKINLTSLIFAMQKVLFWFQFCFALYRVCFRSQNVYSLEFYYQVKLYNFLHLKFGFFYISSAWQVPDKRHSVWHKLHEHWHHMAAYSIWSPEWDFTGL